MPEYLWATGESRLERLLRSPLLAAEGLYRVATRAHRSAYEWGLFSRARLPTRVISVGNLTVGGSGKTPVVAWLARELRNRGRKLAVLSRGVQGGRFDRVNVVSDGERLLLGAPEVGDEPVWIARRVPGVPVLAGRNRVALGLRALALFGAELLLVDDGFQHHRLARDVDLVCIDGRLGLGNGHVLPRGPLRERAAVLARADALLVTRAPPPGTPLPGAEQLPEGPARFRLELGPQGLRDHARGGELIRLEALAGLHCGLLSAIARPDALRRELERLGAEVKSERRYRDHHLYAREEIAELDPALTWLTTAKDAVKIPPAWLGGLRLWVVAEEIGGRDRNSLLDWLSGRLDTAARIDFLRTE